MSKRARWTALGVTVVLGLSAMTATASAQSSGDENPKATDVGITDKEIHIAVLADVDNPIAPNIMKPAKDAVEGIAKYLNSKEGGGGLAGRKVVVDFYDTKLNANAATNAVIEACENDVAMVGTAATGLASVDNMRNCKDSTGAVTGIPDIPFISTLTAHQCSDQSFPTQPPILDCSTKDLHPQTYRANVGRGNYYVKKYGKGNLHGAYLFVADTKATRNTGFASTGALRDTGIESDLDFDISAFSQQSAMTPAIQEMKAKGSTFGQTPTSSAMLSLRKEATLQGLTGVKVWDCPGSCYDRNFLSQGGADVEDNYVNLPFQPFFDKKEQKANPMTGAFVKYTGEDNVGGFGAYAWAAGIAFRDAVNAAVEKHGINGVTRKTIFEALNQIHEFDADGFFGEIDLAGRELSKCAVLMRVKDKKFVRVRPTKVGTILCEPDAVIERQLDLLGT